MTIPAPDVFRAEIDRRLAACRYRESLVATARRVSQDDRKAALGNVARERASLSAFRTILDEHGIDGWGCCECGYEAWPCPTVEVVAAALTRGDQ